MKGSAPMSWARQVLICNRLGIGTQWMNDDNVKLPLVAQIQFVIRFENLNVNAR
jgi:hypothetical protein